MILKQGNNIVNIYEVDSISLTPSTAIQFNLASGNITFNYSTPLEYDTDLEKVESVLGGRSPQKMVNRVSKWKANANHLIGDWVYPTVANGYRYKCTTAGTSGGVEPVWNETPGIWDPTSGGSWTTPAGTTADGTVVFDTWGEYKSGYTV